MVRWLRVVPLALSLAFLAGGEAQAKWLKAETAHFNLYSDGGEGQLRDFAAKLEDFDAALRFFHPVPAGPPPRKLDIYLLKNVEELQRIWPGSRGVAGVYWAGPDDIFAVALRDDIEHAEGVLFHEYTHHFMLQNFAYPYPSWLIEGWAEYFMNTKVFDDRIDVGLPNSYHGQALGDWWLSTEDLLGKPWSELPATVQPATFYARAWLLTHYMLSDPQRRRQLTRYMADIAEGEEPMKALAQETGLDLRSLDVELRDYAGQRLPYVSLKRLKRRDVDVRVSELPRSADDVLLERLRLLNGVSTDEQAGVLKLIDWRTRGYRGDRFADLTLARAHIMLGDPAAAEPILQPYLSDPDDSEAFYLMALRYMRMAQKALGEDEAKKRAEEEAKRRADGEKDIEPAAPVVVSDARREEAAAWYAKAVPWLLKANRADPDSYQVLYAFAESAKLEPGYPSEKMLEILAAAYHLAPQVDEITFTSAQALLARSRTEEGVFLLRLLANDPHESAMSRTAQAMLDGLAKNQTKEVDETN